MYNNFMLSSKEKRALKINAKNLIELNYDKRELQNVVNAIETKSGYEKDCVYSYLNYTSENTYLLYCEIMMLKAKEKQC